MTKCFQCVKDEHYKKITWDKVMDAVVMFKGTGYCFEHLKKELDWDNKEKHKEMWDNMCDFQVEEQKRFLRK